MNGSREDEAPGQGNRKWWGGADEDEDDLPRKSKKKDSGERLHRRKTPKEAFGDEIEDE